MYHSCLAAKAQAERKSRVVGLLAALDFVVDVADARKFARKGLGFVADRFGVRVRGRVSDRVDGFGFGTGFAENFQM